MRAVELVEATTLALCAFFMEEVTAAVDFEGLPPTWLWNSCISLSTSLIIYKMRKVQSSYAVSAVFLLHHFKFSTCNTFLVPLYHCFGDLHSCYELDNPRGLHIWALSSHSVHYTDISSQNSDKSLLNYPKM